MASSRVGSCILILGLGAASAACGSSSDGKAGGGGSGGTVASGGSGGSLGGTGGGGTGGSSGTGGTQCAAGPGYPSPDAPHLVNIATATIVDLDNQPAAKTLAQICGVDICINGSTNDQGEICQLQGSTGICGTGIAVNQEERKPALKYGDGLGYAKFAFQMPTNTSDYTLGTHVTAKLPATSTGVDFVPGGDSTSGGITLSVPAGGSVKVNKLDFPTPDVQKFRAVEIPAAKAPAAVDPAQNFEIIVATTPIETEFCPHAKLTVPNTPNWPAGTDVEFWVHGVDQSEEWAPYAGWAKVSLGKVSADGNTVVTNDGEGVPILSVFGVKKK